MAVRPASTCASERCVCREGVCLRITSNVLVWAVRVFAAVALVVIATTANREGACNRVPSSAYPDVHVTAFGVPQLILWTSGGRTERKENRYARKDAQADGRT